MKITNQQALVMFDICKGCLYSTESQFAGYSKEEIMKLLNDIINQQDNEKLLDLNKLSTNKIKIDPNKVIKTQPRMIRENFKSTDQNDDDNFWS